MEEDSEVARLRAALGERDQLVLRLLSRVVHKDKEFSLERLAWKRERKRLDKVIDQLQRDLNRQGAR